MGGGGGEDGVIQVFISKQFFSCGRIVTDLRSRVNGELQFTLLSIVYGESFHEKRGEAGPGASAERVEDEKPLETRALVGQLSDALQDEVDDFLPDRVVASRVVVGCVLLPRDHLLRMEQSSICAGANFV